MEDIPLTPFQLHLLRVVESLGKEAWGHHIGLRAFKTKPVEDRYGKYLQGLGMNANKKCNRLVQSGYLHMRVVRESEDSRVYYVLTAKGEAALRTGRDDTQGR